MSGIDLATTGLAGVVFGLALAAPPGPMNAVIAEESVVGGWAAGVRAGLGALVADLIFFVLALAGAVAVVETYPTLRTAMVAVGGGLMLYFAWGAVESARADAAGRIDGDRSGGRGFRKALVLSLTNPYQILFWLTVGVGLLRPGRVDVFAHVPYVADALAGSLVVATGSPALLLGLFAGIGIWVVGFPAALVAGNRRRAGFGPVVAWTSALVLAAFGIGFLFDAATRLVG